MKATAPSNERSTHPPESPALRIEQSFEPGDVFEPADMLWCIGQALWAPLEHVQASSLAPAD
jgi:hypothetical protein